VTCFLEYIQPLRLDLHQTDSQIHERFVPLATKSLNCEALLSNLRFLGVLDIGQAE